MVHPLQNRVENEIVESLDKFEGVELDREKINPLLDECVEIDCEVCLSKRLSGSSLYDTKRREPITVRVNLRNALAGTSSLIAAFEIPDLLTKGVVILLMLGASVLPTTERVKPNQALTYGVGWKLSEQEKLFVEKNHLIEEVVDASRNIDNITRMTEADVEHAIQELIEMECITAQEVDRRVIIWFEEEFEVKYSVR